MSRSLHLYSGPLNRRTKPSPSFSHFGMSTWPWSAACYSFLKQREPVIGSCISPALLQCYLISFLWTGRIMLGTCLFISPICLQQVCYRGSFHKSYRTPFFTSFYRHGPGAVDQCRLKVRRRSDRHITEPIGS